MINITNLNKTYDDKVVLSNITFQANKGEITGLIGPNAVSYTHLDVYKRQSFKLSG